MRCTSPRSVGFKADGKTICWSQKQRSKEYAFFQLPCGKCLECRLEYARQWAVRCVHEAQMHEKNSFITLTYSDEHLKSPKLIYSDFQKFMKKLRKTQNEPIGCFVTGEYGEKEKRPHWHAILFNYFPRDAEYLRRNERGDQIFKSNALDKLWGFNDPIKRPNEVGSVTFHSAGYCARYSAKKLVHGDDGFHQYEPVSKKSSKHAIGKAWLEKYYMDFVYQGSIVLKDGTEVSVPRYYLKWLKENKPEAYVTYVTQTNLKKTEFAERKAAAELKREMDANLERSLRGKVTHIPTRNQVRKEITKSKFKRLQEFLKL